MTTIEIKTTLNLLNCTQCGCAIALTENHERSLRNSHETFYCPNGHHQYFPAQTEEEKLRKALHAAELEKTRLAQTAKENEHRAQSAAIKLALAERESARLKKRTAAGVCPCCNRTFVQLQRHMKTKHPEHV